MTPNYYIDFKLCDAMGFAPGAAAIAVKKIHQLIKDKALTLAIYLPEKRTFDYVRVFAEDLATLNAVMVLFGEDNRLSQHYRAAAISQVPSDFDGKWVAITRYRLYGKKDKQDKPEYHQKRIDDFTRMKLNFLRINSKSTGQVFTLAIEYDYQTSPTKTGGALNSYGLSIKHNPVFLPVI